MYIQSPIPFFGVDEGLDVGLSSLFHLSSHLRHFAASSFDTVRIHDVFGSEAVCLRMEGSFRNASIEPQRNAILLRVYGLLRTFSSLVSHLRFSGRLLHLLVSI